ncbi:hypothetical protein D3C73_959790 [compost metagenome]
MELAVNNNPGPWRKPVRKVQINRRSRRFPPRSAIVADRRRIHIIFDNDPLLAAFPEILCHRNTAQGLIIRQHQPSTRFCARQSEADRLDSRIPVKQFINNDFETDQIHLLYRPVCFIQTASKKCNHCTADTDAPVLFKREQDQRQSMLIIVYVLLGRSSPAG